MKQSRLMSLVESVTNVIVGYGVAVVTQILIFPIFGLHTTLAQNLKMGAVFTLLASRGPTSCGGCLPALVRKQKRTSRSWSQV